MFSVTRATRIFLATQPVDMRKSIDGLAAIVRSEWKEDVFAGHLFAFVGRRGDRVKILTWEAGGFALYYKRLEKGRFRIPEVPKGALGVTLDATELAMLLDGIDASRVKRPAKWAPPVEGARQASESVIQASSWLPFRKSTNAAGETRRNRYEPRMPSKQSSSRECRHSSRS